MYRQWVSEPPPEIEFMRAKIGTGSVLGFKGVDMILQVHWNVGTYTLGRIRSDQIFARSSPVMVL